MALKEENLHLKIQRQRSGDRLRPFALILIASGLAFVAAQFYKAQAVRQAEAARKADELSNTQSKTEQHETAPVPAVVSALKRGADHARKHADADTKPN